MGQALELALAEVEFWAALEVLAGLREQRVAGWATRCRATSAGASPIPPPRTLDSVQAELATGCSLGTVVRL